MSNSEVNYFYTGTFPSRTCRIEKEITEETSTNPNSLNEFLKPRNNAAVLVIGTALVAISEKIAVG